MVTPVVKHRNEALLGVAQHGQHADATPRRCGELHVERGEMVVIGRKQNTRAAATVTQKGRDGEISSSSGHVYKHKRRRAGYDAHQ